MVCYGLVMKLKCSTANLLLCVPIHCMCPATMGLKLFYSLTKICLANMSLLASFVAVLDYLVHTTQANSIVALKGGQGRPVVLQAASMWCIIAPWSGVDAFIVASGVLSRQMNMARL